MALTKKQDAFATALAVQGCNQADAYRQAYNAANMSDRAIHVEASKLASRPDIALRVQEILDRHVERRSHSDLTDRELVKSKLRAMVQSGKSEASQLRAAELLGKTCGIFTEHVETTNMDMTADQIKDRLADMLAECEAPDTKH